MALQITNFRVDARGETLFGWLPSCQAVAGTCSRRTFCRNGGQRSDSVARFTRTIFVETLLVLAEALGVRPSDTAECLSVARGETTDPFDELEEDYAGHRMGDAATYQTTLIAALDDEVISEDEWSMLNSLRTIIGIQEDQHTMIEESIRSMAEIDENGTRRIEQLNRFNTVCPY